ncbi:MAG: hypothetical protein HYT12_01535 [Candidatus Liptonbacteria bacterium]|nr:hypothetical protein [Candidatus Liptonbacteria bacterium]
MIPQEKLNQLKQKLEGEKETIEQEIKELEKAPDFGDSAADPEAEEVDEAEEWSTNNALSQNLKVRLLEINSALSKIINGGEYGICEKCGKEMEIGLLEIDPESRLCKECKLNTKL